LTGSIAVAFTASIGYPRDGLASSSA
jgi:hypothetical protein